MLNIRAGQSPSNWAQIFQLMQERGVDITVITESHLRDEEVAPIEDEGVIWVGENRRDHDTRGGGVSGGHY